MSVCVWCVCVCGCVWCVCVWCVCVCLWVCVCVCVCVEIVQYLQVTSIERTTINIPRGADKSLALPGRKQARKHVKDARDFNNIETGAIIKFSFPARQGAEGNSRHSDRNMSLFPSWSG